MPEPTNSSWSALQDEKKDQKILKPDDIFKPIKQAYKRKGLKIGIWGPPETGKTYFGLSAPPPIFVISTEQGVTQVAHHFPNKDIRIVETLSLKPDLEGVLQADPVESLENVEKAISSIKDITEGTIVIDSLSDIWDWVQFWMEATAIGKDKRSDGGVFQWAYGRANERYKYLLLKCISRPTHFVGIARTKPIYAGNQDTGAKDARWQKDTPFMLDIIIALKKILQGTTVSYMSTIEKCRFNRMFDATKENITFAVLVKALEGKLPADVIPK